MNTKYSFRKSVLEKTQYWELTDECILMKQEGGRDLQIPYSEVQNIRLRFLPNNRYRPNNYSCCIAAGQTATDIYSSSYEGIASFSNEAVTYVPFVKELVQKVKDANPLCPVYTGQKAFVYYSNVIFTAVMVIALFLLFHYLPVSMGFGIIVKLLLIGYLGIFLVRSLRVNRPRQLTGSEVPASILPETPR